MLWKIGRVFRICREAGLATVYSFQLIVIRNIFPKQWQTAVIHRLRHIRHTLTKSSFKQHTSCLRIAIQTIRSSLWTLQRRLLTLTMPMQKHPDTPMHRLHVRLFEKAIDSIIDMTRYLSNRQAIVACLKQHFHDKSVIIR